MNKRKTWIIVALVALVALVGLGVVRAQNSAAQPMKMDDASMMMGNSDQSGSSRMMSCGMMNGHMMQTDAGALPANTEAGQQVAQLSDELARQQSEMEQLWKADKPDADKLIGKLKEISQTEVALRELRIRYWLTEPGKRPDDWRSGACMDGWGSIGMMNMEGNTTMPSPTSTQTPAQGQANRNSTGSCCH